MRSMRRVERSYRETDDDESRNHLSMWNLLFYIWPGLATPNMKQDVYFPLTPTPSRPHIISKSRPCHKMAESILSTKQELSS
jgi:hypothetical protein